MCLCVLVGWCAFWILRLVCFLDMDLVVDNFRIAKAYDQRSGLAKTTIDLLDRLI